MFGGTHAVFHGGPSMCDAHDLTDGKAQEPDSHSERWRKPSLLPVLLLVVWLTLSTSQGWVTCILCTHPATCHSARWHVFVETLVWVGVTYGKPHCELQKPGGFVAISGLRKSWDTH